MIHVVTLFLMRSRWIRAAVLGAAAFVGFVGAHVLDYALLYADPIRRSGVLQRTGHSYFGKAIEFAIAAAVLSAIGSFAFGLLHPGRGSRRAAWRTAVTLALIQGGGFIAVEAAERVIAGAPTAQMTRVVVLGVIIQAVVATITAFILSLLERAGRVVARALTHKHPVEQPAAVTWRPREAARPKTLLLQRGSPRAPPLAPIL
jgi:hypothetical protein